jgi:hypothetical protein
MILTTHAIVGAAIASLIPDHPVGAFLVGVASHFAIDAIPHWDYPLRSMFRRAAGTSLIVDTGLLTDFGFIALDGIAGLALAIWVFATPTTIATIMLGALGGMAPDPLQFVHRLYPHEPLRTLQRFHLWIHTKTRLGWKLGVTSQGALALIVTFLAKVLA